MGKKLAKGASLSALFFVKGIPPAAVLAHSAVCSTTGEFFNAETAVSDGSEKEEKTDWRSVTWNRGREREGEREMNKRRMK